MNRADKTKLVKKLAADAGFDHCGIAAALPLDEDARRLERWLHQGMHGDMGYMEQHFDLRIDPGKLVPGAKTVITFLKNYFPPEIQNSQAPQISKYAYGKDYHEVIRPRLNEMLQQLRGRIGDFAGRGFVDSAPVMERAWAVRSGLGWVGKNGNLIHKQAGSFFFIATLITDLELDLDQAFARDYCGTCTRCIDACPTEAIRDNKTVDGSRCISYFTIELKDLLIPEEQKGKFGDWMFGCDVCQDVCPWNRFSKPHSDPAFRALPELLEYSAGDWEALTEEGFKTIFAGSPLKRSKFSGIRRNLSFLKGSP